MILYRWLKGTHHFQQSKTLKLLNLMPTKSVPLSEHLPNFIPTDSKSMSLQTFSLNNYDHGWYFGSIRDLIQWLLSLYRLIQECWSENPANRPTFKQIIPRLESIHNKFGPRRFWKVNWTELNLHLGGCWCFLLIIDFWEHLFVQVKPLKCFRNMDSTWKKENSNWSRRSGSAPSTRWISLPLFCPGTKIPFFTCSFVV